MLPATVHAAFVVLFAWLLKLGADAIGFPLSTEVLTAIAAGLVAYIFGKPATAAVEYQFALWRNK